LKAPPIDLLGGLMRKDFLIFPLMAATIMLQYFKMISRHFVDFLQATLLMHNGIF
jgi:hypothetical protein